MSQNEDPGQAGLLSKFPTPENDLGIDRDALRQIVCASLGRDDLSVYDWHVQPLHYTVRNTLSAGLYRIQGIASTAICETVGSSDKQPWDSRHLAWSLILKVVQPLSNGPFDDPQHWNYWRREPLAYQSGLLERLTEGQNSDSEGLVVPRCWQVATQPDGHVWLWLEDMTEANGGHWPLERYGLAARHFGSFQGGFLTGRPLPSDSWLSQGWMRARVNSFSEAMRRLHDSALWEQPLVRRTCPRSLEERLAQLWNDRNEFLDALDRLPQTLCHLDVWRPNLLSRAGPRGEQTVALDWSYVGLGAVGQDIGNLVPDSLGNFDIGIDQALEMDQVVFDGYLEGLREKGWTGDARQTRLGYAASAALGWGLGTPWWLVWPEDRERQAQIEQQWGQPLEELLAQRGVLTGFVLDLADEARQLLIQGAI